MTGDKAFKVGKWLVEPPLDRITHGDEIRNLRPQVMELLVYLSARPDRVVSIGELLNDLWDGRIVTEGSLYNCISELRLALADESDSAPAIETIPKKGYRLVAKVTVPEPAARPRSRFAVFAVIAVVGVLAGATAWWPGTQVSQPSIRSLAVLPLETHSANSEDDEYFTEAMTETLIATLGRIPDLRVISRTTTEQVKDRNMTVPEIASTLDVDGIVEGSVLTADQGIRITLQLIDGRTDSHLWTRTYVRDLGNILELQAEIANATAQELDVQFISPTGAERQMALPRPVTRNSDAYIAYLKGRFLFNSFGEQNFRRALEYYDEATTLDPSFALAVAAKSEACMQPAIIVQQVLTLEDCEQFARQAISIDNELAEAHVALGFVQLFNWDWRASEESLTRAIELDPNSVMARQWFSLSLRITGRFEEALAEIREAEKRDPLNLFVRTMVSWPLYDLRRFDEALAQLDDVLDMDPEFMLAHYNRGTTFIELRDAEAVFATADRVAQIGGENALEARLLRASAHAISGDTEAARSILNGVEREAGAFMAAWIASVHLLMGDENAALSRLERGLAERSVDMPGIQETRFDAIRDHPRFQAVLRAMKLSRGEQGV